MSFSANVSICTVQLSLIDGITPRICHTSSSSIAVLKTRCRERFAWILISRHWDITSNPMTFLRGCVLINIHTLRKKLRREFRFTDSSKKLTQTRNRNYPRLDECDHPRPDRPDYSQVESRNLDFSLEFVSNCTLELRAQDLANLYVVYIAEN